MPNFINYNDLYKKVDFISCSECGREMQLSHNDVLFCDSCNISLCNLCALEKCPKCGSKSFLVGLRPGFEKVPLT